RRRARRAGQWPHPVRRGDLRVAVAGAEPKPPRRNRAARRRRAMSAVLLAFNGAQAGEWLAALRSSARGREVRAWPNHVGDPGDIAYACVWLAPHGLLARLPNLRAVINLGAGADHLLADPALPDVPTARVVEYVVLHVLMHHRRQRTYEAQQRVRLWRAHEQPAAGEVAVGVMGLGAIGRAAASELARLGFRVAGWSRTTKTSSGIAMFHGAAGVAAFLARTEM